MDPAAGRRSPRWQEDRKISASGKPKIPMLITVAFLWGETAGTDTWQTIIDGAPADMRPGSLLDAGPIVETLDQ